MGTILGFLISFGSVALKFIAALDLSAATPLWIYQPKAPKSLLK